ncbi:MAG TPA: hypothetical protein VEA36_03580 [Candidatus Paceibacterota bacterium]|nr:hypothetical protein [Candidatus Paceibacterota bacterium]
MEKVYAEALERSVLKGGDEGQLFAGLMRHLKAVGRLKLLPGILRELRARQSRLAKLAPSVEVASTAEKAVALKEAKAAGIEAADAVVNDALISGWRGRSGAQLVDRSGKQALIEIYRNIVTK